MYSKENGKELRTAVYGGWEDVCWLVRANPELFLSKCSCQ